MNRLCFGSSVLMLALMSAPETIAARLPRWADAIAERAPALPEGVSKHSMRVLLHERTIEVGADGTMKETIRIANQSLSQTDDQAGLEAHWFSRNTKIKSSKAWHQPPEGSTEKASAEDSLDITLDSSFFSDRKTRFIGFTGMKRGSLVFFEFETVTQPFALEFDEWFVGSGTVDRHVVDLTIPAGWQLIYDWVGAAGPDPLIAGSRYVWEMRDLPAMDREEDLAASVLDRAPRLLVSIVPAEGSTSPVPGFRTWTELGAWYQKKSAGLTALATMPATLKSTDATQPSFRSALYVRDQVRYVSKVVGIGGYIARPAKETSETLWGDCKDKATLLSALLASQHVESYLLLVNASLRHSVSENVPSLSSFDHMVTAVRVTDELAQAVSNAPAVFEAPQLGRLLLIDTTDETNSIGSVSGPLAGKRALLVAPGSSQLVTLPGEQSTAHRVIRNLTVTIDVGGQATFHRETRYYGEPARTVRALNRASAKEREKSILTGLQETWIDAEPAGYEAEPETKDGGMREVFDWTVKELPRSGERRIVSMFPGVRAWLPGVSLSKRKIPVVYEYPLQLEFHSTVKGVPAGTTAPAGKKVTGDGWSVASEYSVRGDTITGSFSVTLEKTEFALSEFDNLKKLNSAVASVNSGVFL